MYLQVECHFSYYYSHDFVIYCYIHRKDKTTCEDNLMPPPPPRHPNPGRQRLPEKINSDKYLTRWFCSKNYGFLFLITNSVNFSTIIIPLVRSCYILSKTWIRLLFVSHTTIILPSLRFAVDLGNFNSPLSLPLLPNFVTHFPLSSNT